MEVGVLVGAVGTIAAVVASAASMAYWLGKRLAEMDEGLRRVDEGVSRLEKAFTQFSDLLVLLLSSRDICADITILYVIGEPV